MRHGRLRFLIADDFATPRRIIGKLLREIGVAECDEAADGRTALDQLLRATTPYDCVIADVDMPRLDGFELVSAMRSTPALASIPALLVSREPSKEQVVRSARVGANGYLVQPLTRSGLEARIRAVLGWPAPSHSRGPGVSGDCPSLDAVIRLTLR